MQDRREVGCRRNNNNKQTNDDDSERGRLCFDDSKNNNTSSRSVGKCTINRWNNERCELTDDKQNRARRHRVGIGRVSQSHNAAVLV